MTLIPKDLLIVSLRIPEDNPEIFDIFKCYFEGIFNITSMCAFDLNANTITETHYVYIRDDILEYVFFKINDNFYEYMQVGIVSLQDDTSKDYYSYVYESWINFYKIYVSKEIEQLGLALED